MRPESTCRLLVAQKWPRKNDEMRPPQPPGLQCQWLNVPEAVPIASEAWPTQPVRSVKFVIPQKPKNGLGLPLASLVNCGFGKLLGKARLAAPLF